jgi:hypothetical protein
MAIPVAARRDATVAPVVATQSAVRTAEAGLVGTMPSAGEGAAPAMTGGRLDPQRQVLAAA